VPHIYTRNSEKRLRQSLRAEMPSAESVLWSKLRRRQMLGYRFRRQYSVGTYVVDFYCAELRLAIEVDGDSHYQGGAPARDQDREEFIKSFGIDFLRFRNVEVFEQLSDVLDAIARRVLEAKPPCSPPLFGSGTWVTPFGDMGNTFMGCCPSAASCKRVLETKSLNRE
jgi:very-short-patch-repair endonuclease